MTHHKQAIFVKRIVDAKFLIIYFRRRKYHSRNANLTTSLLDESPNKKGSILSWFDDPETQAKKDMKLALEEVSSCLILKIIL